MSVQLKVKERPILFSGPMVKAILDGRKTQTRRALKVQPIDIMPMKVPNEWVTLRTRDPNHGDVIRCRFGVPGNRLWVRETWRYVDVPSGYTIQFRAGGFLDRSPRDPIGKHYGPDANVTDEGCYPWKPSIHMPRWASRLTLEVVAVRVERLQAISEADAIAEGLTPWRVKDGDTHYGIDRADVWEKDPRLTYARLWDKINGKRAPWADNPWVWVVEFKRIEGDK